MKTRRLYAMWHSLYLNDMPIFWKEQFCGTHFKILLVRNLRRIFIRDNDQIGPLYKKVPPKGVIPSDFIDIFVCMSIFFILEVCSTKASEFFDIHKLCGTYCFSECYK
jgi:hypothetical protein